jgi:hypothetical protein
MYIFFCNDVCLFVLFLRIGFVQSLNHNEFKLVCSFQNYFENQKISLFSLWPWAKNTEPPAHPGLPTIARARPKRPRELAPITVVVRSHGQTSQTARV